VGSLDFTREVAFDTVDPHDPGHRLLAVFRFWNTVEWWHPYRDGVQGDWDAALARAIDEVIAAPDVAALGVALLRLHVPVSDGHTTLRRALDHRPPSGDCAVDAEVRFLRSDAVVWMEGGGLALGDRVLDIDGRSPEQLVAEWAPLFAASNEAARQRDLARHLFVGDCGPTTVRVRRDGQVMEIPTERVQRSWPRLVHDLPGEAFQLLTPEIAYLQLSRVRASEVPDHVDAAAGTRGWVLDLRGYPSDNVAYALGAHLVQQRTSFARSSVADLANPGTFVMGAAAELTPAAPFYEGKVAILVDEVTQSAAEYAAMAFRAAPRARVFGSTTAGADGSTTRIALSGGWESVITGVGVFWPDGTPTQQVGIVPDVEVVPTAAGIASERDEVLEAARAWILSED